MILQYYCIYDHATIHVRELKVSRVLSRGFLRRVGVQNPPQMELFLDSQDCT